MVRIVTALVLAASIATPALSPAAGSPAVAAARTSNDAACSASLTLTLQPGLHYGKIKVTPAPDIPPGPVIVQAPLYPGATPSSAHIKDPYISYSANPYLETAMTEYQAAAGWNTVAAWYKTAFAACGYQLKSWGQAWVRHRHLSNGFWFYSGSDPHQSVLISLSRAGKSGTLILYLAQDIHLPAREPASYLPSDVVRVKVRYAGIDGEGDLQVLHRTLGDPAKVAELVDAVNSLTDIAAGVRSCAAERGQGAQMRFMTASGKTVRVTDDPACWIVKVDHMRPLNDVPGGVWDTLTRVLDS